MGFALARAAVEAGAEVQLIAGPCHLVTPLEFTGKIKRTDVVSAKDMHTAVMNHLDSDIFFAVAAVADWSIKNASAQKIKKTSSSNPALEFELNPDILAEVAKQSSGKKPYCVGFAAETNDLEKHAEEKRIKKNIPMLLANLGPDTFGLDDNQLLIVEEKGSTKTSKLSKIALSREIIQLVSTKI
jgi:phosphopantothenoylcysteine decarboxylase/phosphopantothenate--cysteine ligase